MRRAYSSKRCSLAGVTTPHVAALEVAQWMRILAVSLDESVLATRDLELSRRHEARVLEQEMLVGGGGDAGHRADLGVGDLPAAERAVDLGELSELVRDAQMVA